MRKLTITLGLIWSWVAALFGQPANDNCSSAIQLSFVSSITQTNYTSGTVLGATPQYTPDPCPPYTSTHCEDVYYKVTTGSSQTQMEIKVEPDPGFDPAVFVYDACGGNLVGCSDNGGGAGLPEQFTVSGLIPNHTYRIRIYDYDNSSQYVINGFSFKIWAKAINQAGSPQVSLTPSSLSFGTVQVGTNSSLPVDIENTGTADLVTSSITYPNGFSGPFSLPVIGAGNYHTFSVDFDPTAATNYSGNIVLSTNDANSPDYINVSGIGSSTPTPKISVSPTSLAYGSVQISGSTSQSITITNTGNATLTVNSITTPYPLVYLGAWSGTIAPGSSKTVAISFNPASAIQYNGNIVINSNASNVNVPVTGSGVSGTPTVITGNVMNVAILAFDGNIQTPPISGATVKLKNSSGTVVKTTTTDSYGKFSFSGVSQATYTVQTTISNFAISYTNVTPGSALTIYIPQHVSQYIKNHLDILAAPTVAITNEDGSINTVKSVVGYPVASSLNLLNTYANGSYPDLRTPLIRMLLGERVMYEHYGNAAVISDQTTHCISGFFDVVSYGISLASIFKKNQASPLLDDFLEGIVEWTFYVYGEVSGVSQDGNTKIFFNIMKDDVIYKLTNDPQILSSVLNFGEYLVHYKGTPLFVKIVYVNPTSSEIEYIRSQATNVGKIYLSSNKNVILHSNSVVELMKAEVEGDLSYIDFQNEVAEVTGTIGDLSMAVAPIMVVTGVGAAGAPVAQSVGAMLKGFSYISLALATRRGFKGICRLKQDLHGNVLYGAYSKNEGASYIPYSQNKINTISSRLDSLGQLYNSELANIVYDIDYSNEKIAFSRMASLMNTRDQFHQAIKDGMAPIMASYAQLDSLYPNFETAYFDNQLATPLSNLASSELAFAMFLRGLSLDTTAYSINTNLVQTGNEIIDLTNTVKLAISQFNNLVVGLQVPAYPVVTNRKFSVEMLKGSSQTVKIYFKNYGNTPITNAYVKIGTGDSSGFTVSTDSVFIGTIAGNASDSMAFSVSAPAKDTTGSFTWQLYGDNTNGTGAGGFLSSVSRLSHIEYDSPHTSGKLIKGFTPNPVSDMGEVQFLTSDSYRIRLVDVMSKTVYQVVTENTDSHTINLSALPTGSYFLTVANKTSLETLKVFITH